MKSPQYLTRPEDFARVHGRGRWSGSGPLGIKSCPGSTPLARYGFVVSKRVGGAVVRNRVKRRLREIMRPLSLKSGTDIIISARPQAADTGFDRLRQALINSLAQAGLLAKNDKENCLGDD